MTNSEKTRQLIIRGKAAIGSECAPYVMAEVGTNHNRSLETARQLVTKIAQSNFNCVKFQIYEPHEIVSAGVRSSAYGLDKNYGDISAHEMFDRYLKTPKEWFPELKELCHQQGTDFSATIHGSHGIDWANKIGLDLVKVASMDHTNIPFLRSLVNSVDVPVLLSLGMAKLEDIDALVECMSPHKPGFGLFHCCAVYPPLAEELRLPNISFLINRYPNVPIGFSDHSLTNQAAQEARRLGACIFEKHVTLDRTHPGPDHVCSIQGAELAEYVNTIQTSEVDTNRPSNNEFIEPAERELVNRTAYLKSLIARQDIPAGTLLTEEYINLARPGTGIPASHFDQALGRRINKFIPGESVIQWEDLD